MEECGERKGRALGVVMVAMGSRVGRWGCGLRGDMGGRCMACGYSMLLGSTVRGLRAAMGGTPMPRCGYDGWAGEEL